MINKYGIILGAIIFLGFGAGLKIQRDIIISLRDDLAVTKQNLRSCEASNLELESAITRQNQAIEKFNTILIDKNTKLATISEKNKELRSKLNRRIIQVANLKKRDTCEETMQWMLEEALTDEDFVSSNIEP